MEAEFADRGYGAFKAAVAEAVVEFLRPIRERYEELDADPAEVDRHARARAPTGRRDRRAVLARARRAAGLLLPPAFRVRRYALSAAARASATAIGTAARRPAAR